VYCVCLLLNGRDIINRDFEHDNENVGNAYTSFHDKDTKLNIKSQHELLINDEKPSPPPEKQNPKSVLHVLNYCLGSLFIYFGWFVLNGTSTLYIIGPYTYAASRVLICTAVSICTSGTCTLFYQWIATTRSKSGRYDLITIFNSGITGAVASSASCAIIDLNWAIVVGFVASGAYHLGKKVVTATERWNIRIHDPLDAIPIHLFGGIWGVLAVSLFAKKEYLVVIYKKPNMYGGLFTDGNGYLLYYQLIGILVIIAINLLIALVIFIPYRLYTRKYNVRGDHVLLDEDVKEFYEEGKFRNVGIPGRDRDLLIETVYLP